MRTFPSASAPPFRVKPTWTSRTCSWPWPWSLSASRACGSSSGSRPTSRSLFEGARFPEARRMALSPRIVEGFRFIGSGRLEEAEQASLAQLRESPEDAQAWRLLGVLRLKQSRPSESREALSKAAHLAPEE